ncbi:DAK2 domain-containing protein [Brevibacterium sp. 50QC2O2]|uniref:DAK2 domain-containing protein n=1 Tax=Brevibacterium TaxID=1696 RepID=UPI00211C069D|nr:MULTISPECIES: DAK2 domain-containing protein [unclassified Brevibacterium]MCQ9367800.1 DAK2 domain-containing protein [Brevibacterium sp. 91QC2O2]MCQ9384894.1 DAK2 domain-containing protein [Brevibacterium sp. 68QC2CO]MCQ9388059.1 DAK2 domain-containing protein [Brevibacterium sp. 50QC2O2]
MSMDPERLGGRLAARWARRIVERMRRERTDIDALNVFPVPDGDTGTNLYHTVRSAYRAVEGLTGQVTLGQVVEAMANGALRGARGNSGLILSVALRGVADGLAGVTELDSATFAAALELAADRAAEAIADPVDGTMLTVLHAMAECAREQADAGADLIELIAAVRTRSQQALLETTGQLDVLSEADVVDAGSSGIVELFDLLYLTATGRDPAGATMTEQAMAGRRLRQEALDGVTVERPEARAGETGYELVFFLADKRDRARHVKRVLKAAGGTSIVVSWPKVHVHVPDTSSALEALRSCKSLGIAQLRVEDLTVSGGPRRRTTVLVTVAGIGSLFAAAVAEAVAVNAALPGYEALVAELAAGLSPTPDPAADDGEASAAPGPDESGASAVPGETGEEGPAVVVSHDAASHVALHELALHTDVLLVPALNQAQVFAALAVYDPAAGPAAVAADMADVVDSLSCGSVVRSGRAAGRQVVRGSGWPAGTSLPGAADAAEPALAPDEVMFVQVGRVRSVYEDSVSALLGLIDALAPDAELLTLVTGTSLPPAALAAARAHLQDAYPEAIVDVVESRSSRLCAELAAE